MRGLLSTFFAVSAAALVACSGDEGTTVPEGHGGGGGAGASGGTSGAGGGLAGAAATPAGTAGTAGAAGNAAAGGSTGGAGGTPAVGCVDVWLDEVFPKPCHQATGRLSALPDGAVGYVYGPYGATFDPETGAATTQTFGPHLPLTQVNAWEGRVAYATQTPDGLEMPLLVLGQPWASGYGVYALSKNKPIFHAAWDGEAWAGHGVSASGSELTVTRFADDGSVILPEQPFAGFWYPVAEEFQNGLHVVTDATSGVTLTIDSDGPPPRLQGHDRQGAALAGLPRLLATPPGLLTWFSGSGSHATAARPRLSLSSAGGWVAVIHEDGTANPTTKRTLVARRISTTGEDVGDWLTIPTTGVASIAALADGSAVLVVWDGNHLDLFGLTDKVQLLGRLIDRKAKADNMLRYFYHLFWHDDVAWLLGEWPHKGQLACGRLLKLKPGCEYVDPADAGTE